MPKFLNMDSVRKRYAGIGRSTVYRWIADPEVGFPKPRKIGARIMWMEEDLQAFDDRSSNHLEI